MAERPFKSQLKARLTKEQWMEADQAAVRAFHERTPLTGWLTCPNFRW